MKKLIALLAILALAVSLFAGCGSTPAPASSSAAAPAAEGPIKIGYVSALSGDTANWGQAGLNGMILTAEKINAAGGVLGRQIEIVGVDGRGDPQDSVNGYKKLVTEDKVVAVVGTNFSSCNIPMAPVATELKVPVVATAASNELVTIDESGNLHPYMFRLCFIDSFQGGKMAEYALQKGITNAAILVNKDDSYSTGVSQFCVDAFKAGGGTIIEENAGGQDTDFRAPLTKIIAANPDVLFIPWIYQSVALIAQQARELGFEGQFIGFDGWDSLELPTMAKGALEGALYCSRPGFATDEAKAYGVEYQAKFGSDAALEGESLFGNDGLLWIVQCIEEAGSADPDAIRDKLENTTSFKGLIGEMGVDPATHNPQRELAIFEIKGTENVLIEMFK